MSFTSILPNGSARAACITDQPTTLIPMVFGTKFTNYASVKNYETWRAMIQDALTAYPTLAIRNVAPTKPAETKETDGSGSEITTRLSPGGAVVTLRTNAADFKEMLKTMEGGNYSVVIGLGSNKVLMTENEKGELVGFTGQCTAIPTGFPGKDAKLEEFQISINWDNIDEWKNYRIVTLPVYLKELNEKVPLGMDMQVKTALSSTTMTVLVTLRSDGSYEDDTLTAVIEDSSDLTSPAVTPVLVSNGEYTLTITKAVTPVALVAGDWIKFHLVKMSTLVHEKIGPTYIARIW